MSYDELYDFLTEPDERPPDPVEQRARADLVAFFEANRDRVFFSRQLEVRYERDYFHWVTNRALRDLRESGLIHGEKRTLRSRGEITLLWHRSFRYYRRAAQSVVELVDEYADPNIGGALGLHGEAMVLEGFAREQFVMKGRAVREYEGKVWMESAHDLDFIFSRDGRSYGIEVKNTLGYLNDGEFKLKIRLAKKLGLIPVFVVRMIPRTWVSELVKEGGFALILGYQLYPWTHRDLARRVRSELGLPVDAPRALESGTMDRFTRWHASKL